MGVAARGLAPRAARRATAHAPRELPGRAGDGGGLSLAHPCEGCTLKSFAWIGGAFAQLRLHSYHTRILQFSDDDALSIILRRSISAFPRMDLQVWSGETSLGSCTVQLETSFFKIAYHRGQDA